MLSHKKNRDILTVQLSGELDHFSAISIRKDLDTLIADPQVRHLVLDMDGLHFMDSSGIGVILGRYRILHGRGGTVCVMRMNPQISRIFKLSGMAQIIPVLSNEKEAAQ